jgi:hypothetical protein
MAVRILVILWPSFLMAAVLEGLVFAAIDPAEIGLVQLARGVSPLGVYTIAFLVFWCVIACASSLTALLLVEKDEPSD